MRILALETSSLTGTVALLDGNELHSLAALNPQQRTAQSLAPAIDSSLRSARWEPSEIQLVAVTQGPGSFTGLRVGVTTAKTLCYAVGAEVLGVNTLDVVASQSPRDVNAVCAVIDAHRQQLFVKSFRRVGSQWESIQDTSIIDIKQWIESLQPDVAVTGPGLRRVISQIPSNVAVVDDDCWTPQADTVARLALQRYQNGERDDLWSLLPQYFRKSAAEEKLS